MAYLSGQGRYGPDSIVSGVFDVFYEPGDDAGAQKAQD